MLLDLDYHELMSMFKDIGIDAWGEGRKNKKAVENVRLQESSVEVDNNTVVANDGQIFECNLCENSTQHPCRKCKLPVCNLRCSIGDPLSDIELHRMHREGDPRCRIFKHNLKCPKCDDVFNQQETLDNHLHNEHSRFTDYSELLLASDGSLSELYIKCTKCTSAFENDYDLQHHVETIHTDDNRKRKHSGEHEFNTPKKQKDEIKCTICNIKFSRKDGLTRHNKNKH